MEKNRMDLIGRYFDTEGVSLSGEDADLLRSVLSRAEACDGFVSEAYVDCRREGNAITGADCCRYRIVFAAPNRMRIDCVRKSVGDDSPWDWAGAETCGTDLRTVLSCLRIFGWELG